LLKQGLIAADDLAEVLTCQAEEILHRVLAWQEGSFLMTTRPVVIEAVPLPEINIEALVLNAIRLADEHQTIRSRIPTLDCGVAVRDHRDATGASGLSLKERIVIASIQRGAGSLRQVADMTRLTEFELLRLVDDLVRRDVLTLHASAMPNQAPAPTGVAKIVRITGELPALPPPHSVAS
jgi:hypothetical protein